MTKAEFDKAFNAARQDVLKQFSPEQIAAIFQNSLSVSRNATPEQLAKVALSISMDYADRLIYSVFSNLSEITE